MKRNSVAKEFLTTVNDGRTYQTLFYNFDAIITLGYRVNSKIATEFRKWAVKHDYVRVSFFAFVRSGWIDINASAMWGVGNAGYGWSRTVYSTTHAYFLGIYPTTVNPSNDYNSWRSFPLRCLYPV